MPTEYRIRITSDADTAGFDAVQREMRETEDAGTGLGNVLSGIGLGLGAGLVSVATAGLGSVSRLLQDSVREGIAFNSQLETAKLKLETLLGSAGAAGVRVEDLKNFAGSTPFELDEVLNASVVLETLTRGALSAGDGLRLVGDVAAATDTPFSELSVTIGRLYDGLQSGRPVGEVLARLQELGAISGETRAQIEELQAQGGDGWAVAEEALSRFSGSMEALSQTLEGRLSTLRDAFSQLAGTATQSAFESLSGGIQALNDALASGEAELGARRLGVEIAALTDALISLGDAQTPVGGAIDVITDKVGRLLEFLGNVVPGAGFFDSATTDAKNLQTEMQAVIELQDQFAGLITTLQQAGTDDAADAAREQLEALIVKIKELRDVTGVDGDIKLTALEKQVRSLLDRAEEVAGQRASDTPATTPDTPPQDQEDDGASRKEEAAAAAAARQASRLALAKEELETEIRISELKAQGRDAEAEALSRDQEAAELARRLNIDKEEALTLVEREAAATEQIRANREAERAALDTPAASPAAGRGAEASSGRNVRDPFSRRSGRVFDLDGSDITDRFRSAQSRGALTPDASFSGLQRLAELQTQPISALTQPPPATSGNGAQGQGGAQGGGSQVVDAIGQVGNQAESGSAQVVSALESLGGKLARDKEVAKIRDIERRVDQLERSTG